VRTRGQSFGSTFSQSYRAEGLMISLSLAWMEDGLKGFPDAINAVYPQTKIQLCIAHMVRNSMRYVASKDYKAIAADLKARSIRPM
jgi:transposase-like protein